MNQQKTSLSTPDDDAVRNTRPDESPPRRGDVVRCDIRTPSLRDQFAMAALTGLIASEAPDYEITASGSRSREQSAAAQAYAMADAMIELSEGEE